MGGGGAADIGALSAFGEAFGIAFQMKDDLLDVTADERSLASPPRTIWSSERRPFRSSQHWHRGRRFSRRGTPLLRGRPQRRDPRSRAGDRARRRAARDPRADRPVRRTRQASAGADCPERGEKRPGTAYRRPSILRAKGNRHDATSASRHHRRADHHRHPRRRSAALWRRQAAEARSQRGAGKERVPDGSGRGRRGGRQGPRGGTHPCGNGASRRHG